MCDDGQENNVPGVASVRYTYQGAARTRGWRVEMSYSYQKSDLTFFARERADGRYGFW